LRYGNKSVISKICEDDEMPFTEDGRRVDLMLNLLAIINRTTSFPLFELMITSICYQVRKKMETMVDYKEKEALLFDIVNEFNENQKEAMWSLYLKLSEDEKKDYIDDAIYNGIYIHQSPLWETKPIFYRLNDILEKYPWLSADNVYINKWGRKIKTLRKAWIGQMYIMKLKQSPIRGHSVRSTGAIDTKGIPTRSYRSRSHLEQYSGTPIRFNITRAEILVIVFSKTPLIAGNSH
jgi:DNA-directed RNA polymerase subunit beta